MRTTTKALLALATLWLSVVSGAAAQATGTPSYSAPLRPFQRSEFGGVVSFPSPNGTAWEAAYRTGTGKIDVGIRGGMFDPSGVAPASVLAGVEARARVLTHDKDFPLDGAFVFGAGGRFRSGQSRFMIPGGLSLGRRIGVDNTISFTPYVQPTAFLRGGNNISTDMIFAMGLGVNMRLSGRLDTRFALSVGDVEGVSLGAVWLH